MQAGTEISELINSNETKKKNEEIMNRFNSIYEKASGRQNVLQTIKFIEALI